MEDERARQAVLDLLDLPVSRQPHDLLLDRVWTLRHNLTAYEAAYLALTELLDARLVTFDRGLAEVAARTVEVVVPPGASGDPGEDTDDSAASQSPIRDHAS